MWDQSASYSSADSPTRMVLLRILDWSDDIPECWIFTDNISWKKSVLLPRWCTDSLLKKLAGLAEPPPLVFPPEEGACVFFRLMQDGTEMLKIKHEWWKYFGLAAAVLPTLIHFAATEAVLKGRNLRTPSKSRTLPYNPCVRNSRPCCRCTG